MGEFSWSDGHQTEDSLRVSETASFKVFEAASLTKTFFSEDRKLWDLPGVVAAVAGVSAGMLLLLLLRVSGDAGSVGMRRISGDTLCLVPSASSSARTARAQFNVTTVYCPFRGGGDIAVNGRVCEGFTRKETHKASAELCLSRAWPESMRSFPDTVLRMRTNLKRPRAASGCSRQN